MTAIAKDVQGGWAWRRWAETIRYDVFEPSGKLVARVSTPTLIGPVAAFGDRLWALTIDADDVLALRRYSISSR
jgi:hypothetical protein